MTEPKFISASCRGEVCSICGQPAVEKVVAEIFHDDPNPHKHPMVAYVCREHFNMIMGVKNKIEPHRLTNHELAELAELADGLDADDNPIRDCLTCKYWVDHVTWSGYRCRNLKLCDWDFIHWEAKEKQND